MIARQLLKQKRWLSPAKINRFLYINYQYQNGYHHIQTLFELIDLCDELLFSFNSESKINLANNIDGVCSSDNLIIKAAQLIKEQAIVQKKIDSLPFGLTINIKKNIPMGAGLGGGSSNAATMLIAMNWFYGLGFSQSELMKMGAKLGADVPFFILGRSAYGQGIGEQLESVDLSPKKYLIIKPEISISTALIFQHPQLTRNREIRTLKQLIEQQHANDCQPIVTNLYPQIGQFIDALSHYGETLLTGTGAALFSVCESKREAEDRLLHLRKEFKHEKFSGFIVNSLKYSPCLDFINNLDVNSINKKRLY